MSEANDILDHLSASGRDFYDRTRSKLILSIVFGAACLMFIGFSAEAGGVAQNYNIYYNSVSDFMSSDNQMIYKSLISGNGFACFSHFSAFCIALSAAIIISPLLTGSNNEKLTLKNPIEIAHNETVHSIATNSAASNPVALQSPAYASKTNI